MNSYRTWLGMALLVGGIASAQDEAEKPNGLQQLQAGNLAFACELYSELCSQEGNLVFSPFAISTAGAMLATGSNGRTHEQFSTAFHLPEREALLTNWPKLQQRIAKSAGKGMVLRLANAACVERTRAIQPDYQKILKGVFQVPWYPMDFRNDPDGCVRTINAWANKITENEGADILRRGDIDPKLTTLILVNASYFRGQWKDPFKARHTKDRTFHLDGEHEIEVPTMRRDSEQAVANRGWLMVVPLDYAGSSIEMLLLVPRAVDGLARVEQELTAEKLGEWLTRDPGWQEIKLRLYLPRFTGNSRFSLLPAVQKLGLKSVLSAAESDLTPVFGPAAAQGRERPHLSRFVHASGIRVDEKGTVAWSKGAEGLDWGRAAPREEATVRVDRPFLFLVRERKTGLILYMGRVMDPGKQ